MWNGTNFEKIPAISKRNGKKWTYQESGRVVQQATEADGEGAFEDHGIVGSEGIQQRQSGIGRQLRTPRQLTLQLLTIFGMDQLVNRLMHHVRLSTNQTQGDMITIRGRVWSSCFNVRHVADISLSIHTSAINKSRLNYDRLLDLVFFFKKQPGPAVSPQRVVHWARLLWICNRYTVNIAEDTPLRTIPYHINRIRTFSFFDSLLNQLWFVWTAHQSALSTLRA